MTFGFFGKRTTLFAFNSFRRTIKYLLLLKNSTLILSENFRMRQLPWMDFLGSMHGTCAFSSIFYDKVYVITPYIPDYTPYVIFCCLLSCWLFADMNKNAV